MVKFCCVVHKNFKEIHRCPSTDFETALKQVREFNDKSKNDNLGTNAYIEEAASVKHLPVRANNVQG